MTALDGQLDIFDQLDPPRRVTCPHCGWEWTPPKNRDDDEALEIHTRRNGGAYDRLPGECANQRMAVERLSARAIPSDVKYRGDLLWALINANQRGVDKAHVLGVLALAEKGLRI